MATSGFISYAAPNVAALTRPSCLVVLSRHDRPELVVALHYGGYYKSGAEQRRINDAVIAEIVLPGFV